MNDYDKRVIYEGANGEESIENVRYADFDERAEFLVVFSNPDGIAGEERTRIKAERVVEVQG